MLSQSGAEPLRRLGRDRAAPGEGVVVSASADDAGFEEQRYSENTAALRRLQRLTSWSRVPSRSTHPRRVPGVHRPGHAHEFDPERVIDRSRSVDEGALLPWSRIDHDDSWYGKVSRRSPSGAVKTCARWASWPRRIRLPAQRRHEKVRILSPSEGTPTTTTRP